MARTNRLISQAAALALLWVPTQLMAQSMDGSFAIDYGSVLINTPQNLVKPVDDEVFSQTKKSTLVIDPARLSFTPSKAQRKTNVASYVSDVAKIAPNYAPQLAAELADGAVFDQYGQMLNQLGLDANDVGDNLAVWWITAWEASMGRPVEAPPAAFVRTKEQVGRILSEKALAAMSNSQKQRYADSLAIQTLILANQIEQAKNNPKIAAQLAIGIKTGAKKMGFDLDAMTLTKDGFVPKRNKRGDASDVLPSSKQAFLDGDTPPPASDGWSNSELAMAAAFGGAGLAGVFWFGKAIGKKG
jgi:hypothetical protein